MCPVTDPPTSSASLNYRVLPRYDDKLPLPSPTGGQEIEPEDSVLLIRLSAIGDVVRLLPAVHWLRASGYSGILGWAVQPPCDDLLRAWPGIDRVHRIDRHRWWLHPLRLGRQLNELRAADYDWVFDVHALLKSAAVSLASGCSRRIGFDRANSKEGNHLVQTWNHPALPEDLPRILKYVQLLRPFHRETELTRASLQVQPPRFKDLSQEVLQWADREPVLVHPRTSHARYGTRKEWGEENFVRLLEELLPELTEGRRICVTWGPGERDSAERIASPFDDRVCAAPETPDLRHLFHLVHRARLVISGDTAPCHMADVAGTPLVALFGSSDHRVSGPLLTRYRLMTTRGDESGTADLPVPRVRSAVLDLLEETE